MTIFGLVGYIAKKSDFEITPMVFGLALGPTLENALRRLLIISHGSFSIFVIRAISLIFIGISILTLFSPLFLKKRPNVVQDGG